MRKSAEKNKINFTRKYPRALLQLAESTTARKKLELLDSKLDFMVAFINVYPAYYKYLRISIQREDLMEKVDVLLEGYEGLRQDTISLSPDADPKTLSVEYGNQTITMKEMDKIIKRVNKLSRRMHRRYKYRLRNSYFDNYMVNDWIISYNNTGGEEKSFLDLVIKQVDEIIIRQIKRYEFYKFGTPLDDLVQDIRLACLTALVRFDVTKGKSGREAFNYFSLICIKAGRMVTIRQNDRFKLEVADSDVVNDALADIVESRYYDDERWAMDHIDNDILASFYKYFYKLFDKRERMQLLLQIMVHFILDANNYSFKKNEFVKFAKSFGFTSQYINKFLTTIRNHKDRFDADILSIAA